jgi:hypothetical protein
MLPENSLSIYGGFHKWDYPKWMVCNGKPYLRKPPNDLMECEWDSNGGTWIYN